MSDYKVSKTTPDVIELQRRYGDENHTFELREGIFDLIKAAKLEAYQEAAKVAESKEVERRKLQREEETSTDADYEDAAVLGGQAFIAKCIANEIRQLGEGK